MQTGDPTGTGKGGQSYWGTPFRDEYDLKGAAKHDERGVLSMANKGLNTNTSQFFITFQPAPHLDGKHTVFGKLVGGEDVLDTLERLPRKDGTDVPARTVKITGVTIYLTRSRNTRSDSRRGSRGRRRRRRAAVLGLVVQVQGAVFGYLEIPWNCFFSSFTSGQ